jgi:hypothetical protein
MNERIKQLSDRITDYLAMGGLFNPELANHLAVRDLLMECREVLNERED